MKYTDITGKKIGLLTVIGRAKDSETCKNSSWLCKCECGNTKVVSRCSLRNSEKKGFRASCGCLKYASRNFTHSMSKTRLYHEWLSMRNRCYKSQPKDYKSYEGRGITVCDEWKDDFVSFMDWALSNGYAEDLSLDRIDVNNGYSPDNCRWITIEEQQRNRRDTIHIFFEGRDWCLKSLCEHIDFPYKTAHQRYTTAKKKGIEITVEKLFRPIDKSKISYKFRTS